MLKRNKLFHGVSSHRLQLFQLSVESENPGGQTRKVRLNEVIYKEGDRVDGMYLLVKGSLKYQKLVVDQVPVEAKTKNKWFRDVVA